MPVVISRIATSLSASLRYIVSSTSILRSSPVFQLLQLNLFFVCVIVVPWIVFFSNLWAAKSRPNNNNNNMRDTEEKEPTTTELPTDGAAHHHLRCRSEPYYRVGKVEEATTTSSDDTMLSTLQNEEDLAPLHFNSLRSPARLRGQPIPRTASRSSSMSRSRSSSPVLIQSDLPPSSMAASLSRVSSERSLDGDKKIVLVSASTDKHGHHHLITEDMLTDRLGFEDYLTSGSNSPVATNNSSYSMPVSHITLSSVNERMSEESLEDCHAFNDIKLTKKSSFGSDRPSSSGHASIVDGENGSCNNSVLGTLEEEDFEDEEEDGDGNNTAPKDLTSLESTTAKGTDETHHIMFEMLDLISTAEERRKLEEERKKKLAGGL